MKRSILIELKSCFEKGFLNGPGRLGQTSQLSSACLERIRPNPRGSSRKASQAYLRRAISILRASQKGVCNCHNWVIL
jgi:hypothetical protein